MKFDVSDIEFIKLRGRPPKKIQFTYVQYKLLKKLGKVAIKGYLLKVKNHGTT
jgi:hypothetical protein